MRNNTAPPDAHKCSLIELSPAADWWSGRNRFRTLSTLVPARCLEWRITCFGAPLANSGAVVGPADHHQGQSRRNANLASANGKNGERDTAPTETDPLEDERQSVPETGRRQELYLERHCRNGGVVLKVDVVERLSNHPKARRSTKSRDRNMNIRCTHHPLKY